MPSFIYHREFGHEFHTVVHLGLEIVDPERGLDAIIGGAALERLAPQPRRLGGVVEALAPPPAGRLLAGHAANFHGFLVFSALIAIK